MNILRYGIIGCGMMGREHIQNLALIDNTEVTALYEPDKQQQRLSREMVPKAKVHDSLASILKDSNVDAFVIASPNFTHVGILQEIIRNDSRPILVEKPVCTTEADCFRLLEMCANYRAPIWVAMEYRYMPVSQHLLAKVGEEKLLGNVCSISIREHRFPFLKKVGDWNRFNANTGGTLVEKCCHFFDLIRLLSQDEVVQVYASGAMDVNFKNERYAGKVPDILDNTFVIMELKSGRRAFLDLCMFCDGSYFQEDICIVGEKGKLEGRIPGPERLWAVDSLDELGASTGFEGKTRPSELIYSPRAPKGPVTELIETDERLQQAGDHHGGTFFQHKYFYEAVTQGREVEVTLEDGVQAVMIGLAAQESIATKSAVTLKL